MLTMRNESINVVEPRLQPRNVDPEFRPGYRKMREGINSSPLVKYFTSGGWGGVNYGVGVDQQMGGCDGSGVA